MADEKKEVKKTKLPTARKRDLQGERANLRNRSYKAKVSTAMRELKDSISKKDESVQAKLNAVYSLMDKGVKTGLYKLNKASRVKSRLTQLAGK